MSGGVVNGQPVDATVTNAAFLEKNADDVTNFKIGLHAASSGDAIDDTQQTINNIMTGVGGDQNTPPLNYGTLPANTFASTDTHDTALGVLARKFSQAPSGGGHTHSGADGDGAPIAASGIGNVSLRGYWAQPTDLSAITGSSVDVSAPMTAFTASTGPTSLGVVVTTPNNRAIIRAGSGDNTYSQLIDATGNEIYGRITISGSIWTLAFYSLIAGTETAYTFSGTVDIKWFVQQLYNPIQSANIYDLDPQFSYKGIHSVTPSGGTSIYGDLIVEGTGGTTVTQSGQTLTISSTAPTANGTVTSVALSDGSTSPIYDISGSPVTLSGTLGFALKNQTANTVFAAPTATGQPSFRQITVAMLPALVNSLAATGGSPLTGDIIIAPTGTNTTITQVGNTIYVGSTGGGGGGITVPSAEIRYTGWQGYGSTNSSRVRFTTLTTNSGGSDLSTANTSTAGATITINTTGIYAITFDPGFATAIQTGIVLNDTGVTRIDSLPVANIIASGLIMASNITRSLNLTAGDVVSCIGDGSTNSAPNNTGGWAWQFAVTRIG